MATLLDLADRMDALAATVPEFASEAAVKAGEVLIFDLAFKTPVDTSQALSNWIVTLNAPNIGNILPHYPGEHGSTQKVSAQETVAAARRVLEMKKPGESIFITNNLPYIVRLNEGHSGQAPAGFVERCVLLARKTMENFKPKVK